MQNRGTPVNRDLIFIMKTGETVVDWGDGRAKDIHTGEMIPFSEKDFGRAVLSTDLEALKNNGLVEAYDDQMVYLQSLPQTPQRTID